MLTVVGVVVRWNSGWSSGGVWSVVRNTELRLCGTSITEEVEFGGYFNLTRVAVARGVEELSVLLTLT